MIFRKTGFLLAFALIGSAHLVGQTKFEAKGARPNIIFIMVDDLGYGDLGVFYQKLREQQGDLPVQFTPALDEMAQQGAIFSHQYSNAPVCAPSRASFLTGMNQGNAHVRNNQFDKALENNHTVATVLRTAGYQTAAVGKWGLQGEDEAAKPHWPGHPLQRGFDYYYGYMRHSDGHEHYPTEGIYRGKKEVWENYLEVSTGLAKCYTTDLWTAVAKRWIVEQQKIDRPFFLFLAYDAPHAVLELPTGAYPAGGGLKGGVQWLGKKGNMINTANGTPDTYVDPLYAHATYDDDHNPSTAAVAWPDTYKRYATSVKRLDDGVRDILQLLKDLHIDDNTLVVFTSDNGPSDESYLPKDFAYNSPTFFGSYGPFDGIKRDCLEGGLRLPVIAKWPNLIKSGVDIEQPSLLSDWMATFADAAGVAIPARIDGVSLLPSMMGKTDAPQSNIYVEYAFGGKTPSYPEFNAVHRGRKRGEMQMLRLGDIVGLRCNIQDYNDIFELYDIVKDPKQIHNLAGRPEMKDIQKRMQAQALQSRRADTEAKRPYDGVAIPAAAKKNVKKGLKYQFYKGNFPYVTSYFNVTTSRSGKITNLAQQKLKRNGMMVYEGFINVPETANYTLTLKTSSKAIVKLHQALAIDADYGYVPNSKVRYTTVLEKGLHPIKIYRLQKENEDLDVDLTLTSDQVKLKHITSYLCH